MTSTEGRVQRLLVSFTERLPLFRKILAFVWVFLVGVQMLAIEGVPSWVPIPFLAMGAGYVVRPQLFRPILVSTIALTIGGGLIFLHVYFRTILMIPLIIFGALGVAGMILSFYGRGPAAFLLGLGLSFGSAFAFPENPMFTSPKSALECNSRVNEMEERFTPFLTQWLEVPRAVRLPNKPTWPTAQPYFLLEIGPQGKWFGDPLPEDLKEAAAELESRIARLASEAKLSTIFLAADVEQPTRELGALLGKVHSVNVMIAAIKQPGPLGLPPPGAEAFANAVEATPAASDKARILALELSRRLGPCGAASKRAALIDEAPAEDRARFMVEEVSWGLRDCQCSYVDLDALEYLMKMLLRVPAHEYSARPIPRDANGVLMIPEDSALSFGEWVSAL